MRFGAAAVGGVLILALIAWFLWQPRQGATPGAGAPNPVAAITVTPNAASGPAAPPAKAAEDTVFAYRTLIEDTSKDRPSACLSFNRPLDPRADIHYGDWVRLTPAADAALRVQDTSLCIDGLSFGREWRVEIAAGLPARDGSKLAKPVTETIRFGEREPVVSFSETGYVLARAGTAGVTLDTVNVEHVAVEVLRIGDRMLPSMLNQLRTKQSADRWNLQQMVENTARPVWTGVMDVQGPRNTTLHTAFPLTQAVPERQPGAYMIVAANAADLQPRTPETKFLWQRTEDYQFAAQWVVVTDLALTAVTAADGLHVYARSLATAAPVGRVGIDLLARDQQVLDHQVTDTMGGVLFAPGLLRGTGAGSASAVFAYGTDGDFAVLDLGAAAFDLSDRGVGGRDATGPIDAFVYTDRGIYRPGETVHAVALMRDRVGKAISQAPLTLVLRKPNGVDFRRVTLPAQPEGGFRLSVDLPDTASRGGWSIEALDADDQPVGHAAIDVQDFVPQRLKVKASTSAKFLVPGGDVAVAVDGMFLYGAPASGLGAEAHLNIVRDTAPFPQAASGYRFGIPNEQFAPPEVAMEAPVTDAAGHTVATGKLPVPDVDNLPLKAEITLGIQEPGGRVTTDELALPIRRPGHAIGIRPLFKDGRAGEGEDAGFEVIAVDEEGAPVAARLHWTLIEEIPHYDWLRENNRWTYHVSYTDNPLASGDLQTAPERPSPVHHIVDWGRYRLMVEETGTGVASSLPFSAGWMETADSADTPDKVDVTVEHEHYAVGDRARLHIVPPFAGHVQVMVARDRVFQTQELEVPAAGATIEVPVGADWGPGAYVLASLYRPADGGRGHLPIRAVGLAWVGVDPGTRLLQVALKGPERVTPRQSVKLPVTVGGASGPVYLTVSAVDEGILQLTRFPSPRPDQFYFGKRRLGAEIRDDYGRLLDGTSGVAGALRSGGDEMGGRGLPVVPTRSVALFSGIVAVGSDGTATIPLDIPDFEGSLRLMAVAFSGDGVGQAEANLIVRDPVVEDVALPRFLAPGDAGQLTLMVDNTDGAAGTYHVALSATGPLSLTTKPLDFALDKGQRRIETVPLAGTDEGIGTVTAKLTGPGGLAISRDWSITVRGAHYPITLASTTSQANGAGYTIDAKQLDAFVPGSVTVSLGYSRLAGIDVPGLLQSLYRYPYGCTEQLTSSAFPLLYYDDAALSGQAAKDSGLRTRVQSAIEKIIDRQNGNGSFGLWRAGDGLGSAWLSLYALDFLNHARKSGYEVSDQVLLRGLGFAEDIVHHTAEGPPNGYYSHPREDETYAEWLLASAGRGDLGRLRQLHDGLDEAKMLVSWSAAGKEPAEPMALGQMSGALAILGDRARAVDSMRAAVRAVQRPHVVDWWQSWSYWSALRDAAGLLAIAAESDQLAEIQPILPKLQELSRSPDDLTTQEKAWLLAAVHAVSANEGDIGLTVNGKPYQGNKGLAALSPSIGDIKSGYAVVNRSGHDLYRSLVVHGSPKIAPSAMTEGVTLAKTYVGLDGQPVDPTGLHQNQRFIVVLRGETTDVALHHLILVDPLPSGWEIEAAVKPEAAPEFLPTLSHTTLREARDDRLVAAVDVGIRPWNDPDDDEIGPPAANDDAATITRRKALDEARHGIFAVAYVVRAVTQGSFTLPEAVAEDMYRPGTMARTKAGTTRVDAPK
jgi:uncharacterized protein YfaS (alpha-2-macroglobulin family)